MPASPCCANETFDLLPDFPTGGIMDAADYNDGQRGGKRQGARADRACHGQQDILRHHRDPLRHHHRQHRSNPSWPPTTRARSRSRKIEDNTAENVEILVHLPAGADPGQTIDALYAFTDCEVEHLPERRASSTTTSRASSASPSCSRSAAHTRAICSSRSWRSSSSELEEKWHFGSLEKIFIEKRIYRDIEKCETWEAVIDAIERA